MVEDICKFFKNKYKSSLEIENGEFANEYCRLLRNHFMHGVLSDKRKRRLLYDYSDKFGGTKHYTDECYEIIGNDFLVKVLKTIFGILVKIDDCFEKQRKECMRVLTPQIASNVAVCLDKQK